MRARSRAASLMNLEYLRPVRDGHFWDAEGAAIGTGVTDGYSDVIHFDGSRA
jgi:hypothetical protein